MHPLDLTADPPDGNNADYCTGLIQADDRGLLQPGSSIGDMILGVPFLRNVYTVMAYTAPNANGSFPINQTLTTHISPRLGLMSLTDPTRAMNEFNTVRVLNQPLTSNATAGVNNDKTVTIGGAKLSIGLAVLLGLMCFIGFCGCLFLIRYLLLRRDFFKSRATLSDEGGGLDQKAAYQLVKKGSVGLNAISEDQLRQIRYDAYKRNTASTASSDRTRVESLSFGKNEDDFGVRIKSASIEDFAWDPLTALDWGGDTLAARGRRKRIGSDASSVLPHNSPKSSFEGSPDSHRRRLGTPDRDHIFPSQHQPQRSVDIPLLSAQHTLSPPDEGETRESSTPAVEGTDSDALSSIPFPLPSEPYYAQNQFRETFCAMEDPHGFFTGLPSYPEVHLAPPLNEGETDEFGVVNGSMAGIGTASRTTKIARDSGLLNRDSLFDTRR